MSKPTDEMELALLAACAAARRYAERHGDPAGAHASLQNRLRMYRKERTRVEAAPPAPEPAPVAVAASGTTGRGRKLGDRLATARR